MKDIITKLNEETIDLKKAHITPIEYKFKSITSVSSRKSSFSEYGNYGTPPTSQFLQSIQFNITATDENGTFVHSTNAAI